MVYLTLHWDFFFLKNKKCNYTLLPLQLFGHAVVCLWYTAKSNDLTEKRTYRVFFWRSKALFIWNAFPRNTEPFIFYYLLWQRHTLLLLCVVMQPMSPSLNQITWRWHRHIQQVNWKVLNTVTYPHHSSSLIALQMFFLQQNKTHNELIHAHSKTKRSRAWLLPLPPLSGVYWFSGFLVTFEEVVFIFTGSRVSATQGPPDLISCLLCGALAICLIL